MLSGDRMGRGVEGSSGHPNLVRDGGRNDAVITWMPLMTAGPASNRARFTGDRGPRPARTRGSISGVF
jgi:hypothetical protein